MKIILVTVLLVIAVLLLQVSRKDAGVIPFASADTTDNNPNGSSDLSKLMRVMETYTKKARVDIHENKSPESYPLAFDKIYSAKISDGASRSDFYKQFSDLYLMSVKNYATSVPAQRIETYNNMVSACLACHSQHCPGPVPGIKKMMIEVK